jgi:glycosyltransferase involved in cell wall biosynthesis
MRKKVLLKGPLLTCSGYGEHARFVLRALRSRDDLFDIYIQPIQWGATSWRTINDEERKWVDRTIEKTINYLTKKGKFDLSLQVTIPNEWEKIATVNIGVTAGIETTKVAPVWLQKGNEVVDKIITISKHSADTYRNTVCGARNNQTGEEFNYKLETPIDYVGYPVKSYDDLPDLELELENDFNFLSVAQFGPRKNLPNTVKWFIEEFQNDNVGLVLKTNMAKNCLMDREKVFNDLRRFVSNFPDRKCKIYLLHGDMTDKEIHSLYKHPKINALVALPHGEGYGLPIFEAAYSGLPVVATGWSGHLDFLVDENKKEHFYNVSFDMQPVQKEVVWENILIAESMWAYPREQSSKKKMRECYEDLTNKEKSDATKLAAENYANVLKNKFSPQKMYTSFIRKFYDNDADSVKLEDLPKISLITSIFKAEEYIEQLMEDITRQTIFDSHCEWVILNANKEGDDYEEKVVLEYVEKYPDNIIYKRLDSDPGIYGTWNIGIKMSTGDYITNVNCDDRKAPWALEKQAKLLFVNDDIDLVYNDSYIVNDSNMMWEDVPPNNQRYNFEQFSKEAMLRGNLPHNNPMWRRVVHTNHGYFDENFKSAGDWELWLRCAFGGSKFKKCNDVLGVYYFNPTGMSTNPDHNSWKAEEERNVFQKYMNMMNQES